MDDNGEKKNKRGREDEQVGRGEIAFSFLVFHKNGQVGMQCSGGERLDDSPRFFLSDLQYAVDTGILSTNASRWCLP